MWGVPFNLYAPYASLYMLELGATDTQVGLITSLGLAGQMLFAVASGHITDRLGRRRTSLFFDLVSWSIPTLIWAFAQDVTWFVVAAHHQRFGARRAHLLDLPHDRGRARGAARAHLLVAAGGRDHRRLRRAAGRPARRAAHARARDAHHLPHRVRVDDDDVLCPQPLHDRDPGGPAQDDARRGPFRFCRFAARHRQVLATLAQQPLHAGGVPSVRVQQHPPGDPAHVLLDRAHRRAGFPQGGGRAVPRGPVGGDAARVRAGHAGPREAPARVLPRRRASRRGSSDTSCS